MAENEMLTDVPLTQIRDFLHHPYLVKDDESMDELVESIKERGLIQPVIIRPVEDGMYEMVSGHRRKRAFEIAGYDKIPARVKEMSREIDYKFCNTTKTPLRDLSFIEHRCRVLFCVMKSKIKDGHLFKMK